jgi:hypothetical protein
MTRRRTSTRAAAIRRAQQAKAQRDADRLAHEKEIEAALADYFEATSQAAAIHTEARRKADKILADAETATKSAETTSREAARRLRTLTGSLTEVAGLCGLSPAAARALLREDNSQPADSLVQPTTPEVAEQAGCPLPAQAGE